MTPTEKLITEARELDRMATPGPWKVDKQGRYCDHDECYVELADDSMTINNFIVEGCRYENAEFIAQSRTLIPALCDALEQAQSTLEQTWEWDMYKCAQREIDRLRKELEQAQNAQRWIPVAEQMPENCGIPLMLVGTNGYGQKRVFEGFTGYCRRGTLLFHSNCRDVNIDNWDITHWMPLPEPPK